MDDVSELTSELILPPELKAYLTRFQKDVKDVLNIRLTSASFQVPAAGAVKNLRTINHELPSSAWSSFFQSDGVMIFINPANTEHLSERLMATAAAFPERLQRIHIGREEDPGTPWHINLHASDLDAFVDALVANKCASNVHVIHIDGECTPQAADKILRHLTGLVMLFMMVSADQDDARDHVTLSEFPSRLKSPLHDCT
jgi:hypothetical protein